MKQIIRLTESDLHRMIKESVKRVLKEEYVEGKWEPGWLEDYYEDDSLINNEYNYENDVLDDIEKLKQTYDDNLDYETEDFASSFVNSEGDDENYYGTIFYPSQQTKAFIDYANRVNDRSSRKESDNNHSWKVFNKERYKRNAKNSDQKKKLKDVLQMRNNIKSNNYASTAYSKTGQIVDPNNNLVDQLTKTRLEHS